MKTAVIGVFDGVHLGHRSLISQARAVAAGTPVLALTFAPHPRSVITGTAPTSLASLPHRIELLTEAGADEVRVMNFDAAFAALSPEAFISDILIDQYAVTDVVVGENFRFGARAAGDVGHLARAGLQVHPQYLIGDQVGRWSSTRIRELVTSGAVEAAAVGLARPYRLEGVVVHGAQRGRTLGYPTANLAWDPMATVPADGVYAGWLNWKDARLAAAISVGTNPQFDGSARSVEAYVLDRDDLDLYGADVAVEFVARLRDQQRFDDIQALQERMAQDVTAARAVL